MEKIKAFFSENAVRTENVEVEVSKRFVDENKKPIPWEIRVLDSNEFDRIVNQCKKRVPDPSNPRQQMTITDSKQLVDRLIVETVVSPNLNDLELQNSYGVMDADGLVKKMLTPGEYVDLGAAVQQAQGFEVGMSEKIKEAKN